MAMPALTFSTVFWQMHILPKVQMTGYNLHLNMYSCAHDPMKSEWADYTAVQADCGNLSGNKLTRISSGNTRPQSSQLTEPLWTDPSLKSALEKKKKSGGRE